MNNIALFASYNGSILETLCEASLNGELPINIALILTNNQNANVLKKAKERNIPHFVINDTLYEDKDKIIDKLLEEHQCEYIILAGYMKKISPFLTNKYFIINSHPSLLPKYGGKGMYGRKVHESVVANKEKESGVSVHRVNEHYDEGAILLQKKLLLNESETAESLEKRVKELEKTAMLEALKLCLK